MEKLIYVLMGPWDGLADVHARVADATVPAVRSAGGRDVSLLVPDRTELLEERNPGRIIGDFRRFVAQVQFWLPTVDARASVEETLRDLADETWGFLVTESVLTACPHAVDDGQRVPGISQVGLLQKPADVSMPSFHDAWAEHSVLSYDLHPTRESYERNFVARHLDADTPAYLGIVIERFPSLDEYVVDETYFGDPAVVQEMIEHLPTFYDFATAIGGAAGEFRWR